MDFHSMRKIYITLRHSKKISKAIYGILIVNSLKKRTKNKKIRPNSTIIHQDEFFVFWWGRNEDTIIYFRDLLDGAKMNKNK